MKLTLKEKIVLLTGFLTICLFGLLLYRESYFKQGKNTEPIGTVIYRHKIAQRRDSKSFLWENVNQKDFVYNHDSIRTDELAEAILTLKNDVKIELDPFSMIVLNLSEDELDIELDRGSLNIDATKPQSVLLHSKGDLIKTRSPGKWKLARDSEKPLEIQSYTDTEINVNGAIQSLKKGLLAEVAKGVITSKDIKIVLLSPNDNDRIYPDKESYKIRLEWKDIYKPVDVLVSKDRTFKKPVFKNKTETTYQEVELADGTYFWKVISETETSEIRRIRIKTIEPIALISPSRNYLISNSSLSKEIYFSWKEVELANNYKLEISTSEEFRVLYFTIDLERNGFTYALPKGIYFWRVVSSGSFEKAVFTSETRKLIIENETSSELVENKAEMKKVNEVNKVNEIDKVNEIKKVEKTDKVDIKKETPKLTLSVTYPKNNSVVDMSKLNYLDFKWKSVPESASYTFRLFNLKEGGKQVIEANTVKQNFRFTDLSKLDQAKFRIEIEGKQNDGSSEKANSVFTITLKEELEKPTLE